MTTTPTMNISGYFQVKEGAGTVILHVKFGKLNLLGTSVEASAEPGYNGSAPITFVVPKDKVSGLIAVSVEFNNNCIPFFIKVGWKNDKPYICARDKDEPWIPLAEKLAQIDNNGLDLSVKIDGEWYTTMSCADRYSLPVSAGNLVCRYLISEGEESEKLAEEIKQVVIIQEKELLASARVLELEKTVFSSLANLSSLERIAEIRQEIVDEQAKKLSMIRFNLSGIGDMLSEVTFWNRVDKIKAVLVRLRAIKT